MVLLVLNRKVGLAAQGAQSQQARPGARHRGEAGRLQAGRVWWKLDWGTVSGMGEVLRLELLLLQVDGETRQTDRDRVGRRESARRCCAKTKRLARCGSGLLLFFYNFCYFRKQTQEIKKKTTTTEQHSSP